MSESKDFEYFREYSSGDDYFADEGRHGQFLIREEKEAALVGKTSLAGYCLLCDAEQQFVVDGPSAPNWRETLRCPGCGLSNRVRNAIGLMQRQDRPSPGAAIYLTEERSSAYQWLKSRYPKTVGSEFLGTQSKPGRFAVRVREWLGMRGGRSEDLTKLSFGRSALQHVLCFDVLEHVPDYQAALSECARVLTPGGTLYITVPFLRESPETLVRAVLKPDGEIEHLEEPEYHGDPLQDSGCLCFYHFGWDFLDRLRDAGFSDVRTQITWSPEHGHLGGLEVFRALK